MPKNPLLSVITVVYNGELFLEKTIQSILNQKKANFELIVIDGKSTDRTVEIIKRYEKSIKNWISEPDNGIYDAMNKGINIANGDWIIFMNAGDIFANNNVLNNIFKTEFSSKIQIIYGQTILKYLNKELLIKNDKIHKMHKQKGIVIINHQSTIIKLEAFNQIGKYDLRFDITSDNHWLNKAINYFGFDSFYYINFPISIFDKTDGLSSNYNNHLKIINEFILISKELDGSFINQLKIRLIGYLKTLYYYVKYKTISR
jgi:glycosyltransferase involved in cell wall biosynthesis